MQSSSLERLFERAYSDYYISKLMNLKKVHVGTEMWSPAKSKNSDPFAPPPTSGPSFPTALISPAVTSALPAKYSIRPLQRSDYKSGFLDVLRVLTTVGEISEREWVEEYDEKAKVPDTYYTLVICDGDGKIVGTGSLVKERKLWGQSRMFMGLRLTPYSIHKCGRVGHIEDIAVAKDQQGKKLGLHIIKALDFIGEKVGCYKTILDCSEANEGFYVKCGYKRAGLEMAHYYEAATKPSGL